MAHGRPAVQRDLYVDERKDDHCSHKPGLGPRGNWKPCRTATENHSGQSPQHPAANTGRAKWLEGYRVLIWQVQRVQGCEALGSVRCSGGFETPSASEINRR